MTCHGVRRGNSPLRYEVKLPDLGEDTAVEITVSEWIIALGTSIEEGDDLLEITTDKAAFCVPCPKTGVLQEQQVREGDEVRVGQVLCVLDV